MTQEEKNQTLRSLVFAGAESKRLALTDLILDRINRELSIIEEKGFADYFILFSRIVEVSNELKLIRSYGRGSAASSLVNFCLDITKINPVEENLIFERFILPKQNRLPDIDLDIPKGSKAQLIERFRQKYPEYFIYHIAYQPSSHTESEDIPFQGTMYKKHNSGIIISPNPITGKIFQYQGLEYYVTNDLFEDPKCDYKVDLVELEYLNRLQFIVNEVGEAYHPYKLPVDDPKVFHLFAKGETSNIFQLNNPSLIEILKIFQPESINDLATIHAMNRPGTKDFFRILLLNKYVDETQVYHAIPSAKEILKETDGLLIYAETFLRLSKDLAGISYRDSETWRRRILRDQTNQLKAAFSELFKKGCLENNIDEAEIQELIILIERMLPFSFYKSHSLSYSHITYWGAYYKTYFRKQFDQAFEGPSGFSPFEFL